MLYISTEKERVYWGVRELIANTEHCHFRFMISVVAMVVEPERAVHF